jgi:nucleoid-associated protein YgaU
MAISTLNSSRYTLSTRDIAGLSLTESVRKSSSTSNSFIYTCKERDTFYSIAGKYYGDPTLFWKIADLNPHVKFPDTISAGTQLRIPMA